MAVSRGHINFGSEDELLEDGSSTEGFATPTPQRRTAGYIVGTVALLACGVVALFSAQSTQSNHKMTARMLFDSPDVHEVVTRNILSTGDRIIGEGRWNGGAVRRLVEEGFKNMTQNIQTTSPELAHSLDNIHISEEHHKAIVHLMGYSSDPRAQRLGLKIAHVVRDSGAIEPEALKHHIANKLRPHMAEFVELHREMYPDGSPLRQVGEKGDGLSDLLTPKRINLMKSASDEWDIHFEAPEQEREPVNARRLAGYAGLIGGAGAGAGASAGVMTTAAPLGMAEMGLAVPAAVLSEATCLLRMMRPLSKLVGEDLNVPPTVTTGLGAANYVTELATCELDAANDGFNPVEMTACPLEYGSEAMDACRDLFTMAGIMGDNNPTNGVQGNHNGDNDTHLGVMDDVGVLDKSDVNSFDLFDNDP